MRKKLNPSSDTPLPLEDSAMADQKITPDVVQPSLSPELPEDCPVVASDARVRPPKKAKSKPVITDVPLPMEKLMEADDDEFSPANLRVLNTIDLRDLVKTELVELSARKPKKDEWFRVHPEYQQQGGILDIDSENRVFWVSKKIQAQVMHDPCFSFRLCVLCVTHLGVPFIWPVKTDVESGGTGNKWVVIPFAAMTQAKEKWTRLYWSQERREHIVDSSIYTDEPKFPKDKSFPELLKLAFRDAVVSTPDHPAILSLKGKAK